MPCTTRWRAPFSKSTVERGGRTGLRLCVLIAGGVASSGLLRKMLRERMAKRGHVDARFGEARLSSDNAVGIALMCQEIRTGRLEA